LDDLCFEAFEDFEELDGAAALPAMPASAPAITQITTIKLNHLSPDRFIRSSFVVGPAQHPPVG